MGKVASSPLERGEASVAARARGPAEILGTFADDRVFNTLERGEIIRLGMIAFREQREKALKVTVPPVQNSLFGEG